MVLIKHEKMVIKGWVEGKTIQDVQRKFVQIVGLNASDEEREVITKLGSIEGLLGHHNLSDNYILLVSID